MKNFKTFFKKSIAFILAANIYIISTALNAFASNSVTITMTVESDYSVVEDVVKYTNEIRNNVGVNAVTIDSALTEAAMQRAAELVVFFNHTRPDGLNSGLSLVKATSKAENIASGQVNARDVVDAWRTSPGHYANMTASNYSSIGVGCAYYNGTYYWCQLFANSKGDGISVSGVFESDYDVKVAKSNMVMEYKGITKIDGKTNPTYKPTIISKNIGFGETFYEITANFLDYKSSNTNVFDVNQDGVVSFKGKGKATLNISLKEDPSLCTNVEIQVAGLPEYVPSPNESSSCQDDSSSKINNVIDSNPTDISQTDAYQMGDVDLNGKVETTDTLMILKHVVGIVSLDPTQAKYADVDEDGKITTSDALLVLQIVVGI